MDAVDQDVNLADVREDEQAEDALTWLAVASRDTATGALFSVPEIRKIKPFYSNAFSENMALCCVTKGQWDPAQVSDISPSLGFVLSSDWWMVNTLFVSESKISQK